MVDVKINSFLHVVAWSGVDIHQLAPELKISQQAFETLQPSPTWTSEQFQSHVEISFHQFKNPQLSAKVRRAVEGKLCETSTQQKEKEKNYSWIYTFFHKLGQLFLGHGFRTQGEWGIELASRIKRAETHLYQEQLHRYIPTRISHKEMLKIEWMNKFNALSDDQFKEALRNSFFTRKEMLMLDRKNKLVIYQNLSQEKKALFMAELYARTDWFQQTYDILEGAEECEIHSFVSKEMVAAFQKDPQKIISQFKNTENKSDWFQTLFYTLLESTIRDYLRAGSSSQIANLFIKNGSLRQRIIERAEVLTSDETKKI